MGYDPSSDNGAEQWRDVYWSLGQNLVDMINLSRTEERWDLLGVGQILKAWGWLVLTDMHGEIIVKEAIDQSRFAFDYDTQEYAYQETLALLDSAKSSVAQVEATLAAPKAIKKPLATAGHSRGRGITAAGRKRLSQAAKRRWAIAKRKGLNAVTGRPLRQTA